MAKKSTQVQVCALFWALNNVPRTERANDNKKRVVCDVLSLPIHAELKMEMTAVTGSQKLGQLVYNSRHEEIFDLWMSYLRERQIRMVKFTREALKEERRRGR